MKRLTYYVDLDDVLVDFVGQMTKLLGCSGPNRKSEKEFWDVQELGKWSIVEAINECLGWDITNEEMLAKVKGDWRFWDDLPYLPHWHQLIALVEARARKWYILTSPSKCPFSTFGKVIWSKRTFGPDCDKLIPTRHKEEFAGPYKVLIDDRPDNIRKFREEGGLGILFPTALNMNYPFKDSPLAYVRREMETFDMPQNWFRGKFIRQVEPDQEQKLIYGGRYA